MLRISFINDLLIDPVSDVKDPTTHNLKKEEYKYIIL